MATASPRAKPGTPATRLPIADGSDRGEDSQLSATQLSFADVAKRAVKGELELPSDMPEGLKDYFGTVAAKEDTAAAKDKADDPQANNRALQAELRRQAKQRKQAAAHVDQVIRLRKQLSEAEAERDAKMDELVATQSRVAKFMELAKQEGQPQGRAVLPVVAALDAVDKDGIPEPLVEKLNSMSSDLKQLLGEIEEQRARADKRTSEDEEAEGPAAKKKATAGPAGGPKAEAAPAPAKPAAASAGPAKAAAAAEAAASPADDPDQAFKVLEQQAECRRRRREKAAETATKSGAPAPAADAGKAGL